MAKENQSQIDRIKIKPVAELKNWPHNPRAINKDRYEQLKKSIQELGFNDVLKITPDGTVIGGNMRLRALTELGITEVPVMVIDVTDDKQIFKIALRDNEEFGYYEEQALAELAVKLEFDPMELQSFEVHLGKPRSLDLVMADFGAAPDIALPDGEKPGFQQITFTLSDKQAESVQAAVRKAKDEVTGEEDNDNNNGNALYYMARHYLERS